MKKTPEENREYFRKYYRDHAEHLRGQSREGYKNNPEQRKNKSEYSRKRRAARTPDQVAKDLETGAETSRLRYRSNPIQVKKTVAISLARKFAKFNLLKMERPCYDCGGVFPPEAMDWDHRPGSEKCFDVAKGVRSHSEEAVIDEIAKCQLVCATCHRIRTTNRRKEKV